MAGRHADMLEPLAAKMYVSSSFGELSPRTDFRFSVTNKCPDALYTETPRPMDSEPAILYGNVANRLALECPLQQGQ